MIKVEKIERVLHLKLSIPPVNVLDTSNCLELAQKLKEAASDQTLAAVLISGEGKCFSAGASVEEHQEERVGDMIGGFVQACKGLSDLPIPSVALVHGFCFGGALELAMYTDFIIADPSAKMAVPEVSLAFFPPFACSALSRIIGRQNAAHLILTGETVDAERAYTMGLVQKIAEQSQWDEVVRRFNKISTPVLRLTKEAYKLGVENPPKESFDPIINDLFLKFTEPIFFKSGNNNWILKPAFYKLYVPVILHQIRFV